MKNNEVLSGLSAIEIYEMILEDKIKRFPPYFWKNEFSLNYARELGIYVIKKHFDNDNEKILKTYGNSFINKIHLHSVLKLFNGSAFEYIDFLYPNRFKPWQFKSCPNEYWNKENAITATIWLVEERLKWDESEVKKKLNSKIFAMHKLNGMLSVIYNDSVYSAINVAYPDKYLPWELSNVPLNFWKERESVKAALRWLLESELQFTRMEMQTNLTVELFNKQGLSSILRYYGGIPYDVLAELYPDIDWSKVKKYKNRYKPTSEPQ